MQERTIEMHIGNPSNLSMHLLSIARSKTAKYDAAAGSGSIISQARMIASFKTEYKRTYRLIKDYKIRERDVKELFDELDLLFDRLAKNNVLLAYGFLNSDQVSKIITKEDQKISALNDLAAGKISAAEFRKLFGHHALNAFELSARRFSEYQAKELMRIARLAGEPNPDKTLRLEDCIADCSPDAAIYSALREELKDLILMVIARLRKSLLAIAKEKKIDDIFSLSYESLMQQIRHRNAWQD